MLDQCSIEERFEGVNQLIGRWLRERQNLIVQFCALSGIHDSRPDAEATTKRLEHFCELLVDYVSTGHFEVYYELIREAEAFDDGSAELAKSLLPHIIDSTEQAMHFHDTYTDAKATAEALPKDLSKLGETLAGRFDYEDQLIETLHEAHRIQVA